MYFDSARLLWRRTACRSAPPPRKKIKCEFGGEFTMNCPIGHELACAMNCTKVHELPSALRIVGNSIHDAIASIHGGGEQPTRNHEAAGLQFMMLSINSSFISEATSPSRHRVAWHITKALGFPYHDGFAVHITLGVTEHITKSQAFYITAVYRPYPARYALSRSICPVRDSICASHK